MNDTPSTTAAAAATLFEAMGRTIRAAHLVKHSSPPPAPGLDHGAIPVLLAVEHERRRVSDLACLLHTDVSTTSRHVTALTRLGLVTKELDPHDRRASVIAVTEEGRSTVDHVRSHRATVFSQVLGDWDPADIDRLAHDLDRLATSITDFMTTHRTTKGA